MLVGRLVPGSIWYTSSLFRVSVPFRLKATVTGGPNFAERKNSLPSYLNKLAAKISTEERDTFIQEAKEGFQSNPSERVKHASVLMCSSFHLKKPTEAFSVVDDLVGSDDQHQQDMYNQVFGFLHVHCSNNIMYSYQLWKELQKHKIPVSLESYDWLLTGLMRKSKTDEVYEIWKQMIADGVGVNKYIIHAMVDYIIDTKRNKLIGEVIDQIKLYPDQIPQTYDCNRIIKFLCERQTPDKAEEFVDWVRSHHLEGFPDEFTFSYIIHTYANMNNLKKAREIIDSHESLGIPLTAVACNPLIVAYGKRKLKDLLDFLRVLKKHDVKLDLFSYTSFINAFNHHKQPDASLALLKSAKKDLGEIPFALVQGIALGLLKVPGNQHKVFKILELMKQERIPNRLSILNALLDSAKSETDIDEILSRMNEDEITPDQVTKNTILKVKAGLNFDDAWDYFKTMKSPDAMTFIILFKRLRYLMKPHRAELKELLDQYEKEKIPFANSNHKKDLDSIVEVLKEKLK